MLQHFLIVFFGLVSNSHIVSETSPSCLYKSEICFGKSLDWIEGYACVNKGDKNSYRYNILNQHYLVVADAGRKAYFDRIIALRIDERGKLNGYKIEFLCFNRNSISTEVFLSKLFDEIGQDQLFHYTHVEKSNYREYQGTYIFEDCQVELSLPNDDPWVMKIEVTRN